jgi:two-component system sensor histidine kinase KdpD
MPTIPKSFVIQHDLLQDDTCGNGPKRISSAVLSTAQPPLRKRKKGQQGPSGRPRYLANRSETNKGAAPYYAADAIGTLNEARPAILMPPMPNLVRVWPLLRHLVLTSLLVACTTLVVFLLVEQGATHGSVIYLVPVVIAAIRWGLMPALFAAALGTLAAAFFFFPPVYSFEIKDPQEGINLLLYVFCAILVSQLASRLKRQLEVSRQREIDLADLYAFSRRLAVAFDVSDIHAAIEDHLAAVMQKRVLLFAPGRERPRRSSSVPDALLHQLAGFSAESRAPETDATVTDANGETWLVRAVAPKNPDYGIVAVNVGQTSKEDDAALRGRLDTVLADATATLERLGVAHAITEARMRAQTDQLRDALIGSVSHELRTPLASILGAATVLASAPALQNEPRLKDLAQGVRDEAERLNNDIQNLLDATRISSDGVKPRIEWADPADILHSALDRCQNRMAQRKLALDLPQDLPLIRVDPILVQQALVQILDNAVKYSAAGSEIAVTVRSEEGRLSLSVRDDGAGLTEAEQTRMWDRFARGERHTGTISGSGLGLWIASAFLAANDGTIKAQSDGPGRGTMMAIELPVAQTAVPQLESDADE